MKKPGIGLGQLKSRGLEFREEKMVTKGFGLFDISKGERITVQITKNAPPPTNTSCTVSALTGAAWSPQPPDGGTGGFTGPTTVGAQVNFGILFNFVPAPNPPAAGAIEFYVVTISGTTGPPFPQLVAGPALTNRTYGFTVV